jgi:adhesin transport system membrane fusion protein
MRERSSDLLASATVLLSFVALAGGLLWAAFAEIDQVSRAQGQIIPTGRVQVVQSAQGGSIARILVREGDQVKAGQILVELDDRQAVAAVGETRNKIAALRIANARIEAELAGRPPQFPSDLSSYSVLVANQSSLFERRVIEQKQAVKALAQVVRIVRQDYDVKHSLSKKGLVSKTVLLAQERIVAEAEAQLSTRESGYLQDLQAEYARNGEELAVTEELLAQRQVVLDSHRIHAPMDGIVKNVRLTTVGGVFRPGDEVLQIVPLDGPLVVEAKLSPAAISYVRLEQPASVKFDAYEPSLFGSAAGRVTYISADTLSEMRAGVEQPFYRVHLSIDANNMSEHNGVKVDLQPGMTATVEIKGFKNTVLNFLLNPLTKTLSNSFGER